MQVSGETIFRHLSHDGKPFCTPVIFSVPLLYKIKQDRNYFFRSPGNELFLSEKRIGVHVSAHEQFTIFSSIYADDPLLHIMDPALAQLAF